MATVSERYPPPVTEVAGRGRLIDWITTVDHKKIGILYLVTSAGFFTIAGFQALLMRVQLALPRLEVLGPAGYNSLVTMHGTTMIFLAIMPMLLGFANYFVPLMLGARDMAFPRLNALSYWLFLFGGLLLYFSYLETSPPSFGWYAYAPLTEHPYSSASDVSYWVVSLLVTAVGTLLTAINLIVTVAKFRAPGMTASRIPVFVWLSLTTAFIILWALPSLTAAQFMLLFDQLFGTVFFDVDGGGQPILWQHLFWFFGHPEVYILVLPAFGMISELVPVFSRKPLFGYWFVVGSGIAIAFYSFLVWAHHMFSTGLGHIEASWFAVSTMIIAVPTGIKVFSWIATMWKGRIHLTTSMLFAIAFVANFTIGGISGVHFATVPVDWLTTDTYYVVAHLHYVLFAGTFLALLAAIYYWFPKVTGRLLDERLGKWHFWLTIIGMTLAFFPMHFIGLMGMPRRVYTYPDLPWWGALNFTETVGAFIIGVAMWILAWNMYVSFRRGQEAGPNPWNAWTLEWATSSPPPPYNFAEVPVVRDPRPLRQLQVEGEEGLFRPPEPDPGAGSAVAEPTRRTTRLLDRTPSSVLGMWAAISSEVFFFGALIVTYLYYRYRSVTGPGPEVLDVPLTALFSVALFASSGTLIFAEWRHRRGDHRGFRLGVLATIALGLVFLLGQLSEYATLYSENVTFNRNLFTSAFYTLTGFHGLHVLVGLIALSILAGLAFAGDFREERSGAVDAISAYWHFVDVVWVVIFSVVYLWTLL